MNETKRITLKIINSNKSIFYKIYNFKNKIRSFVTMIENLMISNFTIISIQMSIEKLKFIIHS